MVYAGIVCEGAHNHGHTHTHMGSYGCRRETQLSFLIEFFSAMSLTSHSVVMLLVLSWLGTPGSQSGFNADLMQFVHCLWVACVIY